MPSFKNRTNVRNGKRHIKANVKLRKLYCIHWVRELGKDRPYVILRDGTLALVH